jgi:hypothetical protein
MYGNNIGRLSWFEKKENGDYAENILLPRSGTLSTAVHDFNGDGHPDIAALVAQEVEAMYLFLNDGKGVFTQQMVFQGHPLYGHSSFELTDFQWRRPAGLRRYQRRQRRVPLAAKVVPRHPRVPESRRHEI